MFSKPESCSKINARYSFDVAMQCTTFLHCYIHNTTKSHPEQAFFCRYKSCRLYGKIEILSFHKNEYYKLRIADYIFLCRTYRFNISGKATKVCKGILRFRFAHFCPLCGCAGFGHAATHSIIVRINNVLFRRNSS